MLISNFIDRNNYIGRVLKCFDYKLALDVGTCGEYIMRMIWSTKILIFSPKCSTIYMNEFFSSSSSSFLFLFLIFREREKKFNINGN